MGKYVLNVSNSTKTYVDDKKVNGFTASVAKLNSQKILKQNTALKYGLTSDTKVTLKKPGSKTLYKMNWIEPNFSTGSRFLGGWTQYYEGSPYKSNTDRIKKTSYFGVVTFIIVFAILAGVTLFFRFENLLDEVIVFNAILFMLSLILNTAIPMSKDDLNNLATNKFIIILNNFLTSFPTWLIIVVTVIILSREDIIINTLKEWELVVSYALIILFIFLKFVFDCISDFNKYDYRRLVESTFTEIKEEDAEERSTTKKISDKERKKSIPTSVKRSRWKKLHISLYFFLLSFILLQYLFLKKSEEE
jgi:hypothetical protein